MTKESRIKLQKEYIIVTAHRTDITRDRKTEILISALDILENIWLQKGDEPWYDTEAEKQFKEWYANQVKSY